MQAKRTRHPRIFIDPKDLAEMWGTMKIMEIARHYQCTEGTISKRALKMGLPPKLRGSGRPRQSKKTTAPIPERKKPAPPVVMNSFIQPPSLARLMAGR